VKSFQQTIHLQYSSWPPGTIPTKNGNQYFVRSSRDGPTRIPGLFVNLNGSRASKPTLTVLLICVLAMCGPGSSQIRRGFLFKIRISKFFCGLLTIAVLTSSWGCSCASRNVKNAFCLAHKGTDTTGIMTVSQIIGACQHVNMRWHTPVLIQAVD